MHLIKQGYCSCRTSHHDVHMVDISIFHFLGINAQFIVLPTCLAVIEAAAEAKLAESQVGKQHRLVTGNKGLSIHVGMTFFVHSLQLHWL